MILYMFFPFGWQGINSIKRAVIKECDGKKGTYELAVEGLVYINTVLKLYTFILTSNFILEVVTMP